MKTGFIVFTHKIPIKQCLLFIKFSFVPYLPDFPVDTPLASFASTALDAAKTHLTIISILYTRQNILVGLYNA